MFNFKSLGFSVSFVRQVILLVFSGPNFDELVHDFDEHLVPVYMKAKHTGQQVAEERDDKVVVHFDISVQVPHHDSVDQVRQHDKACPAPNEHVDKKYKCHSVLWVGLSHRLDHVRCDISDVVEICNHATNGPEVYQVHACEQVDGYDVVQSHF